MVRPCQPRFPIEPLAEAIRHRMDRCQTIWHQAPADDPYWTWRGYTGRPRWGGLRSAARDLLGVPIRSWERWKHTGLTMTAADQAACALGRHPVTIWPDWYERTAQPGDFCSAVDSARSVPPPVGLPARPKPVSNGAAGRLCPAGDGLPDPGESTQPTSQFVPGDGRDRGRTAADDRGPLPTASTTRSAPAPVAAGRGR